MPAQTTAPASDAGATVDLDLDARRAARLEKTGPKTVKHGGREWKFRPELPMQVAEIFTGGNITAGVSRILLDPGEAEEFMAAGDLVPEDFKEILSVVYGMGDAAGNS